jgi:hypothetical protein
MGCFEEDKELLTRLFDAYNYTRITGNESEVLTCKGLINLFIIIAEDGSEQVVVEIDESQKK